jgi:uncharacterized protein YjiS (DUF1127 family)
MDHAFQTIGSGISSLTAMLKRQRDKERLAAELSLLTDRELADIGLTRGDVPQTFWGNYGAANSIFRRP